MKKICYCVVSAALFCILPVKSFALVDAEIYGGYTFNGDVDDDASAESDTPKGPSYGFRGHFTSSIIFIKIGLGGFMQYSQLDYDLELGNNTTSVSTDKTTYGLDGYAKLDLPLIPVKPYMRIGVALYDKIESDISGSTNSETEHFNSFYYGIGLAFTVLPLPIVDVQLFGEYLYNKSSFDDTTIICHNFNVGAQIAI
jgi:hypothetical protein